MGSLKLPHASGNSMSIAAPATNPASDLELKLPATIGTAGQVLKNSGTAGTFEFGYAIEVDMWQFTEHFDSGNTTIANNWSRCGNTPFEKIGTGMSESSGAFTFPSTGKWQIEFSAAAMKADYPRRYLTGHILTTQNNSNYNDTYYAYTSTEDVGSDNVYAVSHGKTIFDVTDTSTHKVKFKVTSDGAVTWLSDDSGGIPYSYVVFTRLGDT